MTQILPDLSPITRYLRAKASSNILVAAVLHLNVFEELDKEPKSVQDLQAVLGLRKRPAMVLFPALCAMNLVEYNTDRKMQLSTLGRFLTKGCHENLIGYVGLEKDDRGVLQMTEWLKNDGPKNSSEGFSYVKDEEAPSPMDEPETARFFTLALAGRARFLSPIVASKMTGREAHLLDVAGGTGFYSYEWLLANPRSRATIFDRPEVLNVASQLLEEFCELHKNEADMLRERVTFMPGDMLSDPLPTADILLAASLFHDWPEDTCEMLAKKFAAVLKPGGELWIHDAFLDDTLDGPIAVTDYSAMLFLGTKGRAYSRHEYRAWLSNAGLTPATNNINTGLDYGLIWASKPQ